MTSEAKRPLGFTSEKLKSNNAKLDHIEMWKVNLRGRLYGASKRSRLLKR